MSDSGSQSAKVLPSGEKATPNMQPLNEGNKDSVAIKANRSTRIPLLNNAGKLSRSHDNLASMLRRKAMQCNSTGTKKTDDRPRSAHAERRASGPVTPKARTYMKSLVIPPMRKSSSIQNFERGKPSERFASRAQSILNICRIPLPVVTRGSKTPLARKRSSSAQNMINSGQRSARQPQSTAVACNAELLSNFEKEKKTLERRISELIQTSENRKAEVEKLKFEVKKKNQDLGDVIQSLCSENQQLRAQLHEHGITTAHFTDNDKILLLEQISNENRNILDLSHEEALGNVRAASDGTDSMILQHSTMGHSVGNLSSLTGRISPFHANDFSSLDRLNSLSVDRGLSDIGIAYLRDRILEMQETHYSTNEELQATLQELSDLQDSVNELTAENERLIDEKSILLESLCTQTEKLENARLQIEHLKALLIQDSNKNDRSENERQLAALIKSAQEEREELLLKQAEFNNALTAVENENRELQDIVSALRDRAELEESKSKVFQNDKRILESQMCDMKNQKITDQLELAKCKALLETERQLSAKAGQENTTETQVKLEEMLTIARKKKKVPTATLR